MLDDTLDRLLRRQLSDPAAHVALGVSGKLQEEMSGAGLHLVLVPEEDGGLGGTLAEAATVAWRCGWHAAPVPIVEMLLLPALDPTFSGKTGNVAFGPPAPKSASERVSTQDASTSVLPLPNMPTLSAGNTRIALSADLAARGMLLTAGLMTGAMARVVEIAGDYANTRVQFGRPLVKFQVIQHKLAEAASELAVTEAALAAAIEAEDEGCGSDLLRLSAKAQAGVAATVISAMAHQVFGAIGFTEEHELHRHSRNLWRWRDDWGRQADCDLAIGRAACATPNGLWSHIVDKQRSPA